MKPLSIIARTSCDMFSWFMVIFGVYVIVHGDASPGGGFQGGAVVATFPALFIAAYGAGKALDWLGEKFFKVLELSGLILFIVLGFMGLGWKLDNTMMYNFSALTLKAQEALDSLVFLPVSGTVALMNIAVGIEVVGALTLVLLIMYKAIRLDGLDGAGEETGHDQ